MALSLRISGEAWRIRHLREILTLAVPIVLTMLSQTLMWTVDTIFLGHYSSLALGAAGLGGLLTWAAYSLFNNLSRISNTFVAQAHGRGDDAAVGRDTWQVLYLATAAGLVLTWLGQQADRLLPLTGNAPEIVTATAAYVRYRTLSAVFTQVGFCLTGFFQGRRRTRVPMWAGIVGNLVNVALDPLLIYGWDGMAVAGRRWLAVPEMGVTGAAVATSIGVTVSTLVMAAAAVLPRDLRRRYRLHAPRRPDLTAWRRLVRVGAPSAVEGFVDMSGFAVFTALIGRTGATALAASQITVQLLSFSFMPVWGLTSAGAVLVGNHAGRRDHAAAADYGRQLYKLVLTYTLLLGTLLVVLRGRLFGVFTGDPAVQALGPGLVLLAALFQVGDGLRMAGSGLLTGAGDTRPAMLTTLVVMWGLFLPLTGWLVTRRGGGVTEAWALATFCYFLQAAVLGRRFAGGAWRRIDIRR